MTEPVKVTHGKRDDPLRPQVFDPADVEVIGFLDTKPPRLEANMAPIGLPADIAREIFQAELERSAEERERWEQQNLAWFGKRYPSKQCDHCGAHIRWAYVIKYLPTGQNFVAGQVCGEERMELPDRRAFDVRAAKMAAESRKVAIGKLIAKATWAAANPVEAAFIGAYEGDDWWLNEMASKLNQYGSLSEKQTATITKAIARGEKKAARKAEDAKALENVAPIEAGRFAVTGEIVHHKVDEEGQWGPTHKALLKAEDGNRYWVSVPQALFDLTYQYAYGHEGVPDVVGAKVTIAATWTPSNDDPHFAFGKRPVLKDAVKTIPAAKEDA